MAIISDFDLTQQLDEARTILEGLAQNVTAEEASVFNTVGLEPADETTSSSNAAGPSGPGWHDTTDNSHDTTDSATRVLSDTSSNADWAYCLSLSEEFASLDLPNDVNVAALDEDGKVAELKAMFAELNEVDLRLTLKKAKGDFTKACEELLNLQYLEENGLRPKGIEGAFRGDETVNYQGKSILSFWVLLGALCFLLFVVLPLFAASANGNS